MQSIAGWLKMQGMEKKYNGGWKIRSIPNCIFNGSALAGNMTALPPQFSQSLAEFGIV